MEEERPRTPTLAEVLLMPEMGEILPEHYAEVREYFTQEEFDSMTEWLKTAYVRQRRNYLVLQILSKFHYNPF